MRERLTVSFVLLTLVVLVVAGIVRGFVLDGSIRETESRHVAREAATLSAIIEARQTYGQPVDEEFLSGFAGAGTRIEYDATEGTNVVVTDPDFEDGDDTVSTTVRLGSDEQLTLTRAPETANGLWGDVWSLVLLIALLLAAAGLCAYLIARQLSAPFRQLASAAAALGRGRFELDLPHSRVPEVQAISRALGTSAGQLRAQVARERAFALHASHVLRTPLTAMRMELEGLALDTNLPSEARGTIRRCVKVVDELDVVAGQLVELTRSAALVEGSEITLHDLATQAAQRWADELDEDGRTLTAVVEGAVDTKYTPGPVEQVLDGLLADMVRHCSGPVHLGFEGDDVSLRLEVCSPECTQRHDEVHETLIEQVGTLVEALGGRLQASPGGHEVKVLLPRR